MFGRFSKLHLKKKIIHIGNNARHAITLLDYRTTSMPKKLRCKKVGSSQPKFQRKIQVVASRKVVSVLPALFMTPRMMENCLVA
jgi:hypothetical protein